MRLNIAGRIFDSEEIHELTIREAQKEVFDSTQDDFFRIRYRSAEEIADVYFYKELDNITNRDIDHAIYLLSMVCKIFVNSKEQCNNCPLKKNTKCIFLSIPNDWR